MPVTELTSAAQYDKFLTNNDRAIVFYGSKECGYCRSAAPVFEKLSDKHPDLAFAHIEVTKVKVAKMEGMPTFVCYRNQEPIDKVVGFNEKGINRLIRNV